MPAAARFSSPESKQGQVQSPASDVFSIAAVLARLLTRSLQPRTSRSRPPVESIPAPLRPVLNRALTPEPADRFATAGDLLGELDLAAQKAFGLGWLGMATFATVPRQREAPAYRPAAGSEAR